MSDHVFAAAAEDGGPPPSTGEPLLSPPPRLGDYSPPLPLSAYYHLFLLLLGAVASVIATVALILNVQSGYEADVFRLSSFDVFRNSSTATWEASLSGDLYVTGEARAWVYSRSGGFVSVGPAAANSGRGSEIVVRSIFTMGEAEEEAVARDGVLVLDLLVEANATRGSGAEKKAQSYVMVECSDLEIEFAGDDRSFGVLSGGGRGKRCGAQIYGTKSDALKGSRILDLLRRFLFYLTFRRDPGEARVARRRTFNDFLLV